jgi:hypothetical protein
MARSTTPPIGFTQDNFEAVIRAVGSDATNIKTETRRVFTVKGMTQEEVNTFTQEEVNSFKSKYQVGDQCYLTEPTQILNTIPEDSIDIEECELGYFWGAKNTSYEGITDRRWIQLTDDDSLKICNRSTGIFSKQNQRFMLKAFARYHILIESVSVERLFDITREGAIAEGIATLKPYSHSDLAIYKDYYTGLFNLTCAKKSYFSEIAKIYEKKGGWDFVKGNPWMWVYRFRVVES